MGFWRQDLQVTDIPGSPTEARGAEEEEECSKEPGTSQTPVLTIPVSNAIPSLQADVI